MRRTIPPLNPLHVFEAAARLGNFTRAAQELQVTQSTVSRQIAVLEAYLNVELFQRGKVGVSLTHAGEEYRQAITPAFAAIGNATDSLKDQRRNRPLVVRVYPTFAVKWLIPRMSTFTARWPQIEISLRTGVSAVDFLREDVDFSIELFADGAAPETSKRLFPDLLQPVCSPEYASSAGLADPADLARCRLLHSRYRRRDWLDWLDSRGVEGLEDAVAHGTEFPSSLLTYQAAMQGFGVAMGQVQLLDDDIRRNRLVPLFAPPLVRKMAYHAVWSNHRTVDVSMRALLNWLLQEIKAMDQSVALP